MSHRTGIRFPAESGPVQTTIGNAYLEGTAAFNTESARCHWIS